MSDLMGRKLLPAATPQVPYSLHDFADEEELPESRPVHARVYPVGLDYSIWRDVWSLAG
jgi:hypothetical protein